MRQKQITVTIVDREALKTYTSPDAKYVVISVTDPGRPNAEMANDPARVDHLRLAFYDTDTDKVGTNGVAMPAMSLSQAAEIVDFVSKWRRSGIEHFVCQCELGIARSSAIAAAILKIHNDANDDSYVFKEDLVYIPNMRVYSMVLFAAFGMTGK